MSHVNGLMRKDFNWFPATRWSMVLRAGRGEVESRHGESSMRLLCEDYWTPVYSYVRRRGYDVEDAQDLTQGFFAQMLEKGTIGMAEPTRGKFRAFLLTSLKHYLADERDKAHAAKRGGGVKPLALEFEDGERAYSREPANTMTPEQIYERRWALALLEKVLRDMEFEYDFEGKGELFRVLRPCLVGERASQPYAELAEKLGKTTGYVKTDRKSVV